jgi:hypothetical protein
VNWQRELSSSSFISPFQTEESWKVDSIFRMNACDGEWISKFTNSDLSTTPQCRNCQGRDVFLNGTAPIIQPNQQPP